MNRKDIVLDTVEMISLLMGELESIAFEEEGFSDITMNQMLYLEVVARLEEPTFGEIADHLNVTRPSVTGIIKKLIDMDYVRKVQSEIDGRVYHVHLTDKGIRFNELHNEVHQILARRITESLEQDEIEALSIILEKITPD